MKFEHVTVTNIPSRKSPWMVRYYKDKKPIRTFHPTEEKANEEAARLDEILAGRGDPEDTQLAHRLVAGTGYKLADLVKLGLEGMRKNGAALADPTKKFREGTDLVIERARRAKRREVTIDGYVSAYKILNKTFGERTAAAITVQDVEKYITNLKSHDGESPAASDTKRNAIRHIKMALTRLKITGTLDDLELPGKEERPIDFFSVAETLLMLRAAPDHVKGLLIIAFFAALRPTLLSKLPANCVDVAKRRIKIPAHLAKDKKSHTLMGRFERRSGEMIPGTLPDEMWPLLEKFAYQPGKWEIIRQFLKRRNGRWTHDGTRHTAATFHDRFYGKQSTAALLTHAGEALVYDHYVGDTTPEEAEAFFSIKPIDLPYVSERKRFHFAYPPEEELRRLVDVTPITVLAKKIGCSDKALAKHCLKRGISPKPPGYWAKTAAQAAAV